MCPMLMVWASTGLKCDHLKLKVDDGLMVRLNSPPGPKPLEVLPKMAPPVLLLEPKAVELEDPKPRNRQRNRVSGRSHCRGHGSDDIKSFQIVEA